MSESQIILPESELRRLQLVQLELLEELDRVCRKHGIRYLMDGGTMIGAVRHKGFIPWDDDIDVAMLREDYEKFKRVAWDLNSDLCFFQDHTTDPHYRWGYGKLRKKGTSFIRQGQEHIRCQDGVFIDIFPFDDIPKSRFMQKLQDMYLFCLRKILWSEVGRVACRGVWRTWYWLLSKIPHRLVLAMVDALAAKSRNDSPRKVRILMFPAFTKKGEYGLDKRVLLEVEEFEFEGKKFLGYKNYDERLSAEYGDYMKLPPEAERVPHLEFSSCKF